MPAAEDLTDQDIERYNINTMWINSHINPSDTTIATRANEDIFNSLVIQPVIKWAKANPDAKVNLWYDSVHTTEKAVEASKRILDEALKINGISNAELRDVREIPCVKNNPDVFSQGVAIYFRIDLLKLIVLLHSIETDNLDAAVFSDLEVGDKRESNDRMGKQELFNTDVCKDLRQVGFVVGDKRYGHIKYDKITPEPENQFLQLYNNPLILDAVRHNINKNFSRAINALIQDVEEPYSWCRRASSLSQKVYTSMFYDIGALFHAMQVGAKIDSPLSIDPITGICNTDMEFYHKEQAEPIEALNIPQRNMSHEVRPGRSHGEDKNSIQQPPSNGEYYCCSPLPYQRDEARAALNLSAQVFTEKKAVDKALGAVKSADSSVTEKYRNSVAQMKQDAQVSAESAAKKNCSINPLQTTPKLP